MSNIVQTENVPALNWVTLLSWLDSRKRAGLATEGAEVLRFIESH